MHLKPRVILGYDIRGLYEQELSPSNFHEIGSQFLSYLAMQYPHQAVQLFIGRDNRPSSERLEHALCSGMAYTSSTSAVTLHRLGTTVTPLIHHVVTQASGVAFGMMITASHNPLAYNGLKCIGKNGATFEGQTIQKILQHPPQPKTHPVDSIKRQIPDTYIQSLRRLITSRRSLSLTCLWHCYGSTEPLQSILSFLPGKNFLVHTPLRDPPDPLHPENIQFMSSEIKKHSADISFAFDGDGDRLVVFPSSGQPVLPEQITMILANHLLSRQGQKRTVIGDIQLSRTLKTFVEAHHGKYRESLPGHSTLRQQLLAHDACLASEVSGHFYFGDLGYDDPIYAALQLLCALAKAGQPSLQSALNNLPPCHCSPQFRIPCHSPKEFLYKVATALETNFGHTINEHGHYLTCVSHEVQTLLRASRTQHCITLRCEATSEAALAQHLECLTTLLRRTKHPFAMENFYHKTLSASPSLAKNPTGRLSQ